MSMMDQIKKQGMSDDAVAQMLGVSLSQIEADVAKYESGDLSGWQFGASSEGRPYAAPMRTTSVKLYEHELRAIDRLAAHEGITRSAFIRRAIDRDLLAAH